MSDQARNSKFSMSVCIADPAEIVFDIFPRPLVNRNVVLSGPRGMPLQLNV